MTDTKCKAKTASGAPCNARAVKNSRYCFTHDSAHAVARQAARKRGGENRHTPHFADASTLPANVATLEDARKILGYTLAEVIGMDNTIARAKILLNLFDSFMKSIEIGELEARIAALEAVNK